MAAKKVGQKTKTAKKIRVVGQTVFVYHGNDFCRRPATILEVASNGCKVQFVGEAPASCPSGITFVLNSEIQ